MSGNDSSGVGRRGGWPGVFLLQLNSEIPRRRLRFYPGNRVTLARQRCGCLGLRELRINLQGRILPHPKSGW
jgi:hypothetical protein